MTNGVHADLRRILVSPSLFSLFLRGDPVRAYTFACCENLAEEAELVTPYTPKIDVVRDVSRAHPQTMTVEPYNPQLMSRAARWDDLLYALNKVKHQSRKPGKCACGKWLYTRL